MRHIAYLLLLLVGACSGPVASTTPTTGPAPTAAPATPPTPPTTPTITITTEGVPPAPAYPYDFARYSDDPVVLGGEGWHSGFAAVPFVVREGDTWYLFYSGGTGGGSLLGLATSTDGLEWVKSDGPSLDPAATQMGWMVVAPWDGQWVMWWTDGFRPPAFKFYQATAPELIGPWTEEGQVSLVPDRAWDTFMVPTGVTEVDGTLWMAYAAYPQLERIPTVALMTSTDGGSTWVGREAPVLEPTPGSWNEKGVVPANVIVTDLGLELFYLGFSETPKVGYQKDSIPMGRLISTDGGETWEPDNEGNPILDTGERGWPGVTTAWVDDRYHIYFGDDLGGRGISLIIGSGKP